MVHACEWASAGMCARLLQLMPCRDSCRPWVLLTSAEHARRHCTCSEPHSCASRLAADQLPKNKCPSLLAPLSRLMVQRVHKETVTLAPVPQHRRHFQSPSKELKPASWKMGA